MVESSAAISTLFDLVLLLCNQIATVTSENDLEITPLLHLQMARSNQNSQQLLPLLHSDVQPMIGHDLIMSTTGMTSRNVFMPKLRGGKCKDLTL